MGNTSLWTRSLCCLLPWHWIVCWTGFSNWLCMIWLCHVALIFDLLCNGQSWITSSAWYSTAFLQACQLTILCMYMTNYYAVVCAKMAPYWGIAREDDPFPAESYSVPWIPIDSPGMVKILWIFKSVWLWLPQNILFMAITFIPAVFCSVFKSYWCHQL